MNRILSLSQILIFSASSAFGSGFMTCELNANVLDIQAIGTLDETARVSYLEQYDSYRYVAGIEVVSAKLTSGDGECPIGRRLIALKRAAQVKPEDSLKIEYQAVHDRTGQSETYKLIK